MEIMNGWERRKNQEKDYFFYESLNVYFWVECSEKWLVLESEH